MRNGLLGGVASLFLGTSCAWSQGQLPGYSASSMGIQPVAAFTKLPAPSTPPKSYQAFRFATYEPLPQRPSEIRTVSQVGEPEFLPPPPTPVTPESKGGKGFLPPPPTSEGPGSVPAPPIPSKTEQELKGLPPGSGDGLPLMPAPSAGSDPLSATPYTPPPNIHAMPAPGQAPPPGEYLLPGETAPHVPSLGHCPPAGPCPCDEPIRPVSAMLPEPPPEPTEPYMVGYCEEESRTLCDLFSCNPCARQVSYVKADYLVALFKKQGAPVVASAGVGGSPTGVTSIGYNFFQGPRLTVGRWLNTVPFAIEGSGFYIERKVEDNTREFPGRALFNAPFFDGITSESVSLEAASRFWGAEATLRTESIVFRVCKVSGYVDFLGGFRYLDLGESLSVRTSTLFATAPVELSDDTVITRDDFVTHNQLYLGQVGFETGLQCDRWHATFYGKLGVGANRQSVSIRGQTTRQAPPQPDQTFEGGFLAQPSNVGDYRRNAVAIVPEVGASLEYELSKWCRVGFGYTFVYLFDVVRPGEQIDPVGGDRPPLFFLGGANPRPNPQFTGFGESDFWAQGIHVRLEVSY